LAATPKKMRHLKKKYLKAYKVGDNVADVLKSATVDEKAITEIRKNNFDGYYNILVTEGPEGNELIQTFQYNLDKRVYFIPEPNPIVVYFEIARSYEKDIKTAKLKLLDEYDNKTPDATKILAAFNHYYSISSVTAIFLFTALEGFINNLIPEDYKYFRSLETKTEVFDKQQVQENLLFEEKIKKVIPEITNKNFAQDIGHKYEIIKKLKLFRDEIIHTKSYNDTKPNFYKGLFTTSLDFDYEKTMYAVRDYINYHENNLIEECNCGSLD
jgi:hypothetical protein